MLPPGGKPRTGHKRHRLAGQITGRAQATYSTEGSRLHLERDSEFANVFTNKKQDVFNMNVRFVSEPDPWVKLALKCTQELVLEHLTMTSITTNSPNKGLLATLALMRPCA